MRSDSKACLLGNRKSMRRFVVFRLPFKGLRNEFLSLRGDPRCQVRWLAPQEYEGDADVIILPGSGKTIADLNYLRQHGGDRIIRHHLSQGKKVIGICAGYQMFGEELFDPFKLQGDEERVQGLGLLPVKTYFGPTMLKSNTKQKLLVGTGAGGTLQGVEVRSGVTVPVSNELGEYSVLAHTWERDFSLQLDVGPPATQTHNNAPLQQTSKMQEKKPKQSARKKQTQPAGEPEPANPPESLMLKLAHGEEVLWAPGTETHCGLVSPDRQVWGTYLHLIFHNEPFVRSLFATMP
jgi:cobyric acid synthase